MTFTFLTLVASSNPGVYQTVSELAMLLPIAFGIPAVTAGAVGAIAAFGSRSDNEDKLLRRKFLIAGLISAALFAGGAFALGSLAVQSNDAHKSYYADVSEWMVQDFGIRATADQTERLVDGESFVADYDSEPTTVSIVETFDGDIALVDEDSAPLKPLN